MTTLALQRKADKFEKFLKNANRALLEFEVAQSKWDFDHGKYKVFDDIKSLKRYISRKMK